MATTPTDPLFAEMWHLQNTGQVAGGVAGVAGIDIRVLDAWDDYTGSGVRVAVVDEGVESTHPDLEANYDSSLSFDVRRNTEGGEAIVPGVGNAGDNHGTFVAGFIGAAANNGEGGVGVAYGARLGSLRINLGTEDEEGGVIEVDADPNETIYTKLAELDIDTSNHSYGPGQPFASSFSAAVETAMESYVTEARGDLGGLLVVAAGNDRLSGGNTSFSEFAETPYDIAVAANTNVGQYAHFSNPGAGLLVTAAGHDVLSTDRTPPNGYDPDASYATSSGTSFAAPIVTGVTALMLEANPGLGGRDVQQILAYSAFKPSTAISVFNPDTGDAAALQSYVDLLVDAKGVSEAEARGVLETPWDWQTNGAADWNGGGLHVSHDYGFGFVDARAAVRLAESWGSDAQTYADWRTVESTRSVGTTVTDGGTFTDTLTIADDGVAQRVLVSVELDGGDPEDLSLRLTSPDGTVSYLWQNYDLDVIADAAKGQTAESLRAQSEGAFLTDDSRVFGSTQHWGESIAGDWTLTVEDSTDDGDAPTLVSWGLAIGTEELGDDDRYVFTDELSDYAASEAARATLADTDGVDTLNAAMVTTGSSIDLTAGATSVIDGTGVVIDSGTTIELAHGGDGADTIFGNEAGNTLWGWRGSDIVSGGAGDDVLYGGTGFDIAKFSGSRTGYDVFANTTSDAESVVGGDGTDSLFDVERYSFDDREFDLVARFTADGSGAVTLTRDPDEIALLEASDNWAFEGYEFGATVSDSALATVEVYRFVNTANGSHFYTASADERDAVILGNPRLAFEGISFTALDADAADTEAVYRLYDSATQTHIYTADTAERDALDALSTVTLEGVAWHGDALI